MPKELLPNIWKAVREDNLEEVQEILRAHPEMLNMQEEGTLLAPLHIAAALYNQRISRFLLSQEGIDGWVKDHLGRSALAHAHHWKDQDFINLFARRMLPKHMQPSPVSPVPTPGGTD